MAGEEEQFDLDRAEQELHQEISTVLSRHGVMVTKWILAAELLDQKGERALESFASPDFRAWDAIGMVGFLDARERGAAGADAVADREGE